MNQHPATIDPADPTPAASDPAAGRLTDLERRMREVEAAIARIGRDGGARSPQQSPQPAAGAGIGTSEPDWRRVVGVFTGDDGMTELFDEAMRLRDADRRSAKR